MSIMLYCVHTTSNRKSVILYTVEVSNMKLETDTY